MSTSSPISPSLPSSWPWHSSPLSSTLTKKENYVKKSYFANYDITEDRCDIGERYELLDTMKRAFDGQSVFDEEPDIIINIVDTTQLERSLYLTTQLMELDTKVIVALNMDDLLAKKGIFIDEKKLDIININVKEYKIQKYHCSFILLDVKKEDIIANPVANALT